MTIHEVLFTTQTSSMTGHSFTSLLRVFFLPFRQKHLFMTCSNTMGEVVHLFEVNGVYYAFYVHV